MRFPTSPAAALVARDQFQTELRSIKDEIRHLSERVDRLQLTLAAGFMSMARALLVIGLLG